MTEKPLSPAMASALQAIARMKGDSAIAWTVLQADDYRDDRYAPIIETDPQQRWKPAGR